MMDINIRKIDAAIVKIIEEQAKRFKMSRNQYIKFQLEKIATHKSLENERNKMKTSLDNVTIALEKVVDEIRINDNKIKELNKKLDDILYLLLFQEHEEDGE